MRLSRSSGILDKIKEKLGIKTKKKSVFEKFSEFFSLKKQNLVSGAPPSEDRPFNAYLALAIFLRERGEILKATRLLEKLRREKLLDEEKKLLLLNLALSYRAAGFLDRAESAVKEALRLFPKEPYLYFELAKLKELSREWDEVVRNLRQAVKLGGNFKRELFYAQLSWINELLDRKRISTALRLLKELEPQSSPFFYYTVAKTYYYLGEREKAFERAVAGISVSEGTAHALVSLIEQMEGLDEEKLKELLRRVGLRFSIGKKLLKIYMSEGREREALELAEKLTRLHPLEPELKEMHLRLLWKLGRKRKVVDEIADYLQKLKADRKAFKCEFCGFETNNFSWMCPKCRSWETLVRND